MSDSPTTLCLTPAEALDMLAHHAHALRREHAGRVVIGLAGGPGVGKSTLAEALVARLDAEAAGIAAYVPMDGFHMRHAKLEALGLAPDKGAPHTFEGEAFADFLAAAKAAERPISRPGYSRKIEDVVQDAFIIAAETRILVAEGNYLLLPEPPWNRVRPLLDSAVFISVPRETVRTRLMKRHAEAGLFTAARNREHIERVDLSNYDLVARSRPFADLAIDIMTDS